MTKPTSVYWQSLKRGLKKTASMIIPGFVTWLVTVSTFLKIWAEKIVLTDAIATAIVVGYVITIFCPLYGLIDSYVEGDTDV